MSGNGENHNKSKIGREDVTAEAQALQSFHFGAPPASVSTEAEEYNTNLGPPPQAFAPEPLEPVAPYPTTIPNSNFENSMMTEVLDMPDDGGLDYVDMSGMDGINGVDTLGTAPHHVPEVSFNNFDYHTQADLHEYNQGETVPAPPRPSIVILDRASIAGLQHRPSIVSETAAPGAPAETDKVMLVQEPVPPRRVSLDLPVHYEVARHSIDIVRRDQDPKEIHKPNKNLVAKARKRAIDISEHEMPISELCAKYESRYDETTDTPIGLSEAIAKERLRVNGPNSLKPPKKTPGIVKFLKELTSLFSLMLIVAGLLTFLTLAFDTSTYTDTIILGAVLFVIAFVNSLITYLEERKNEKILAGFSQLAAKRTKVYRDGLIQDIDVKELVVGDIVRVNAGDKVPADLRVLKSNGVKVDNSSLTGESDALLRTKENTHKNPLETHNLMFYGTLVVEGEGYAMVIRTANDTVIGQIANLATNTAKQDTPLRQEINHFVKTIGLIAVLMAVVFFCIGFGMGNPTQLNIIFAIGIICANIPQGLIAIVSLALSISAKRLATRNVLVKSLESVETLGSTTCICSDKTGTLTQNRMTVVDLWYDDSLRSAATNPAPAKSTGKKGLIAQKTANIPSATTSTTQMFDENSMSTLQMLQRACILCNRTIFEPSAENLALPIVKQKTIGDASETALLKYYATRPNYPSTAEIRAMYPKLFEIPFNSTIKYQLSVHKLTLPKGGAAPAVDEDNYPRLLLIKGAPERIIKKCSKILIDGKEEELDDGHIARFEEAYETLAGRGERVLGFAQMYLTAANGFPKEMDSKYGPQNVPQEGGFTFLGLTGLQDPPKPGVLEAIQKCKTAGIQVVMVTGDHQLTAKAIAKQIKIIEDKTPEDIAAEKCVNVSELGDYFDISPAIVLNGEQLESLTDEQWAKILKKKQIVFARTSPQQKLLIVDKFQSIDHIVGVTGDGVNDSPALKKANIGISMGITGSDVSKEAASLVLLDDNFASIVNGIEEGRVIFDNLKKSVTYTLTHIMPEIIPFIVNVVFKIPLPLPALLLLMIDIGTDLFSAVSMAYEKAESDILLRKPRSKDDRLITWQIMSYSYFQVGVIETLGCLFAYFVTFGYYGIPAWALYHSTITYFRPGAPNLVIPHSENIFSNFLTHHRGTLTGTWTPTAMVFTAADQIAIMQRAQSAYFVALVVQQIANMFACKTRINSLVMQGIWNNKMMIIGPIWGIVVTVILLYVPGINNVIFHTYPIDFVLWLPSLAYFVLILFFSEMTKLAIRHSSKGNFLLW